MLLDCVCTIGLAEVIALLFVTRYAKEGLDLICACILSRQVCCNCGVAIHMWRGSTETIIYARIVLLPSWARGEAGQIMGKAESIART